MPSGQTPEGDPALQAQLERFIGNCWDTGLEIGSSVRSLDECLAESAKDITVQTSLLEARRVTGNTKLFIEFQRQFQAAMDPQSFLVAKTLEMNQRHTKFDNTPYALEPNCKESPGGLRDLQMILWVARAAGLGQDITVRLPNREIRGRFVDMDRDGALLLEGPDGVRQTISAGDVFL